MYTHQTHKNEKAARTRAIIDIAEGIFIQKGFEQTSMDELAMATGLTKRTLYKYFRSKVDLYFAVTLKNTQIMMAVMESAEQIPGTGMEKLKSVVKAYQSFAKEKPQAFRLLNYSQFVVSTEDSPNYMEVSNLGRNMFMRFNELVKTGKKDGSISNNFDETKGIFALFFMVTGFFFRITEIGPGYTSLYGVDVEMISDYAVDLMFYSMTK